MQNDNAPGLTGDGYVIGMEAGLELIDMEFVQFYPLVYAGSGRARAIVPAFLADHGTIINRRGEDLKEKHGLHEESPAVVSRDRLSQALFTEIVQGNDIDGTLLLDLRGLSGLTDFFVIGTGRSDRQMHAVLDHIADHARAVNRRAFGVTDTRASSWVLADYVDVVIHLFDEGHREYYDLDGLWGDAPRVEWREAENGS